MTTWDEWAARSDTTKIFLVETAAVRLADGLTVPLYLSNHPYQSPDKQFLPCVSGLPRLTRQANDTLDPNHIPTWGELEILLEPDCRPDAECSVPWTELLSEAWNLRGQPLTIKLGDPGFGYGAFRTIFRGGVGSYNWTDAQLTLTIYDRGQDLAKKIPDFEFSESPRVAEGSWGKVVPMVLGKVKNYKPTLINDGYSDPYYPVRYALACHVMQDAEAVYLNNSPCLETTIWLFVPVDLFPARKEGLGAAVMDPSGAYTGALKRAEWLIQIDSIEGGAGVGQATFRWSLDGGATWLGEGLPTRNLTDTPIPLADGVAVHFLSKAQALAAGIDPYFLAADDDFALGDEWRFILGSSLVIHYPLSYIGNITVDGQGLISPALGAYTDKIGELIRALLVSRLHWDAAADFDLDALDAFNAAVPYQAGLVVDSPTELAEIVDQLLTGIPALYTINQAGQFFMVTLTPVTTAPDDAVELTDAEFLDLPEVADGSDNLYRRVYLNYDRNPNAEKNPQNASQDRVAWLENEFRQVLVRDETVLNSYPWAGDLGPLDTVLVQRADAQAVAARNLALYRVKRPPYRVRTKIQPFHLDLWDMIWLRHARFGVARRAFAIRGVELDLIAAEATLTLWR